MQESAVQDVIPSELHWGHILFSHISPSKLTLHKQLPALGPEHDCICVLSHCVHSEMVKVSHDIKFES